MWNNTFVEIVISKAEYDNDQMDLLFIVDCILFLVHIWIHLMKMCQCLCVCVCVCVWYLKLTCIHVVLVVSSTALVLYPLYKTCWGSCVVRTLTHTSTHTHPHTHTHTYTHTWDQWGKFNIHTTHLSTHEVIVYNCTSLLWHSFNAGELPLCSPTPSTCMILLTALENMKVIYLML